MDAELRQSLIGRVLSGAQGVRYELGELVGEGRSGWVFKTTSEVFGTPAAVKVFRPELVDGAASLTRFAREATFLHRALAALSDRRGLAHVIDHGTIESPRGALPCLVREYLPGQNLARVIAAHGGFGLPAARARRVMGHVARGLFALHEAGAVFRDLKPSHVLIAQDRGQETARITDGFVTHLGPQDPLDPPNLLYGAPESFGQVQGPLGPEADVYSFAAVLYELLCGTAAFAPKPGEPKPKALLRLVTGDRPQLGRVRATLPAELRDRPDLVAALDREIGRATSTNPQQRHGSIRELWLALEPLLREAVRPTASGGSAPDEPVSFDSVFPRSTEGARLAAAMPVPPPSAAPVAAPMPAWEMLGPAIAGERLRAAMVVEDGRAIVALGTRGLYRLAHGAWSLAPLPAGIDVRAVRGLSRLPSGELLLFGDAGLCAALSSRGGLRRIALPEREITLLAAHADDRGIVLVGERASRPGGVAIFVPNEGAPTTLATPDTARLAGVTRTSSGHVIAVGTQGTLVEISERGARDVPWGRTGHLYAISAGPGGVAYAVGSGGHALRVEPAHGGAVATLESVQTTRDLVGVAVDPSTGGAWAVGADARLLERQEGGWIRVPLDPSVTSALLLVWPRGPRITVVAEDGSAYFHGHAR
ncbi:serine/threonine-protein kinase [Polyangium sp. y55x31]|uniref:serine/threonine protein kinase n=1 Tax=Polyangium sp. y55x31 TaxID=3042688 RepID=UPI0024822367|nr:serine/threonine-protein kinase [Polyangium sp. y55x31]MDI1484592.1 serine/threonine-protein kinase [Polyangium sp. y55x31]